MLLYKDRDVLSLPRDAHSGGAAKRQRRVADAPAYARKWRDEHSTDD